MSGRDFPRFRAKRNQRNHQGIVSAVQCVLSFSLTQVVYFQGKSFDPVPHRHPEHTAQEELSPLVSSARCLALVSFYLLMPLCHKGRASTDMMAEKEQINAVTAVEGAPTETPFGW